MKKTSSVSSESTQLTDIEIKKLCELIKEGNIASKELELIEENGGGTASRSKSLKAAAQKGREASDEFTQANMGLVFYLANKYKGRGLSEQDLTQEGFLALIQAINRFDPSKGVRFSTYAAQWIEPVLKRAAGSQNRVLKMSAGQVAKQIELNRAVQKLEEQNLRSPTAKELSKEMKIEESEVTELLKIRSAQFSSKSLDSEDEVEHEYKDDHEDIEEAVVNADVKKQFALELDSALDDLGELEKEILTMRFGLGNSSPMSLGDVAKAIQQKNGTEVTKEKIRSIEEKAIRNLRIQTKRQLRDKGDEDLERELKSLL